MGGTGQQAALIPDTALYTPLRIPPSLWHASCLWRAAVAGRCRRSCPRGENLRPLHPSCICGEIGVRYQRSSVIKQPQQTGGRTNARPAEDISCFAHFEPQRFITMKQKKNTTKKFEVNELGERKLLSLSKTSVICVIMISCRGITVVSHVSGRLQHKCVRVCVRLFPFGHHPPSSSHTSSFLWPCLNLALTFILYRFTPKLVYMWVFKWR